MPCDASHTVSPDTPAAPRVALWLAPDQTSAIGRACAHAGIKVAQAGSPVRGSSAQVALELKADHASDLRLMLREAAVDVVVLGDPGDFGTRREDAADLAAAAERGVCVLTLDACPASLRQQVALRASTSSLPMPIRVAASTPGLTADTLESFGQVNAAMLTDIGPASAGNLGARLLACLATLDRLFGEPERVDASTTAPATETLRDLHGRASVHLHYDRGRTVTAIISDEAAGEHAGITLIGEGGLLRVADGSLRWDGPDGKPVDAPTADPALRDPAEVLGDALLASLRRHAGAPIDQARLLAAAGAVLLSARTSQSASPDTVRDMATRV